MDRRQSVDTMAALYRLVLISLVLATACSAQLTRNQVRPDAYGVAWNGDRYRAGSADAVYDAISAIVPVVTDPNIVAIAALNATAGQMFYWTGPGAVDLIDTAAYMRGLLNTADLAALLAAIGVDPNLSSGDIPDSNDPDITAPGQIGRDKNDHSLRGFDGVRQYVYGMRDKTIQFTRTHPKDDCNDLLPVWSNGSRFIFDINDIDAWSNLDDCTFTLKECDADGGNVTTIETVTISTDGTGLFYTTVHVGDIDHTIIEAGHLIYFDADATCDPNYIKVTIRGWYDADKN
jgi:hypothetical protein